MFASIWEAICTAIRNVGSIISGALNRTYARNFYNSYNYSGTEYEALAEAKDFSWVKWFKGEYVTRIKSNPTLVGTIVSSGTGYVGGVMLGMYLFAPLIGGFSVIPALILAYIGSGIAHGIYLRGCAE